MITLTAFRAVNDNKWTDAAGEKSLFHLWNKLAVRVETHNMNLQSFTRERAMKPNKAHFHQSTKEIPKGNSQHSGDRSLDSTDTHTDQLDDSSKAHSTNNSEDMSFNNIRIDSIQGDTFSIEAEIVNGAV